MGGAVERKSLGAKHAPASAQIGANPQGQHELLGQVSPDRHAIRIFVNLMEENETDRAADFFPPSLWLGLNIGPGCAIDSTDHNALGFLSRCRQSCRRAVQWLR